MDTHALEAERIDEDRADVHVDRQTKALLDSRTPFIMAAIELGEALCTAAYTPTQANLKAVEGWLGQVDSTLATLRRAWMHAPLMSQRSPQ